MKRSIKSLLFMTAVLSAAPVLSDASGAKNHVDNGIIQIYVVNEEGQAVANAPIFITQNGKIQHVESNTNGLVAVDLPEGFYQVSSAVTRPFRDGIDRFASGPAQIQVVSHDTTSVVLTLRPIGDSVAELNVSTLQKMGVADEVAKFFN